MNRSYVRAYVNCLLLEFVRDDLMSVDVGIWIT